MTGTAGIFDRLASWATGRPTRHSAAVLELATTLLAKGQAVEAAAWCERVLRDDPDHADALLLLVEIGVTRGDWDGALRALSRLRAANPGDAGTIERMASGFRRAGDPDQAADLLHAALRRQPASAVLLCELGDAEAARGRFSEALAAYEGALAATPGKSRTATQRAILVLRQSWGPPGAAPADKRQPPRLDGRVMCSELGTRGRFGSQLAQYMAVRICGHLYGLRVEVPEWVGRWLFDLDDPYPGAALPDQCDSELLKQKLFEGTARQFVAEHDLSGLFFVHTSRYRPHRPFIQTLFRPGERATPVVNDLYARLRQRGGTVIALHLGRGNESMGATPLSWCIAWLDTVWRTVDAPVLYLAGDRHDAEAFKAFAPVRADELGVGVPGAAFFTDFHVFTQADLVAISGSSDAFVASMLNRTARDFVRPDPVERRLVSYDPWDAPLWQRDAGKASVPP
ncbi:MAG TPA: tetratricopeptide repeat protein [Stellaceae bacterium]|nr:tetratricopeptide repeat protein [Stellaceae bacterium]